MLDVVKNLKKAVDEFLPIVKSLDDQIAVQEGKLDNLIHKRVALEKEIEEKILKSDEVLALDKAKAEKHLKDSEQVLSEIHSLFLTVYKAKVTNTQLNKEQADKFSAKVKESEKKVANLKED